MAKLFVKQDGGFRYLGEGTIYKKSQLKTMGEAVEASLNKTLPNVAAGAQEAQKTMNQQPNVNGVTANAEQLDGNSNDNGSTINVDVKNPNSIKQGQTMLNAVGNDNATVHYFDGTKTSAGANASVSALDEGNVISFTKSELAKFLKNL